MVPEIIKILKNINDSVEEDYTLDVEAFTSLSDGGLTIRYRLVMTIGNVSFVSYTMTQSEIYSEMKQIESDREQLDKYHLSSSNRWSYVREESKVRSN